MGYVVRCSDAEAIHREGYTYLQKKDGTGCVEKLLPPTQEGVTNLRRLYAEENRLDDVMDYGEVPFSMNMGDYMKPLLYSLEDDFSWHSVSSASGNDDLFSRLMSSVKFERVGKGRLGTVLVDSAGDRGTPIVRTTTKYSAPARGFQAVHQELVQQIAAAASLSLGFNNALIENYSNE